MTANATTVATRRTIRSPLLRFLFVHEIDDYPTAGPRTGYLAVAVLATIVLYYTYYTQTGVTPEILRSYHMPFADYVWIVIISNLVGAFASLPASRTDRLGRSNVIIFGLLVVGLLVWLGVPATGTTLEFGAVITAIGLVEGAILVATPAMVRDYSPQLGRASAMGFWTVGPVAGSLITSIVANHTLAHFVDWQSQFDISGLSAIAVFAVCLVAMKDLSPRIRDQLVVSSRDRALVEARALGISERDVEAATAHPWRQIATWDLALSALGISVFLLLYYIAAAFFTIYYSVTFVNGNGLNFSTAQANGLNTWFWAADIVGLILAGALSDRLKVRKPLILVGVAGAVATLVVFLGYATHPHTGYYTLAATTTVEGVFVAMVYAPWMASYTETVEAKNPALVGTGLAVWGWILRLVVGISFVFLPVVINTVNPVVDNQPAAAALCATTSGTTRCMSASTAAALHVTGPTIQAFVTSHRELVATVTAHAAIVSRLAAHPTIANIAAAERALGSKRFGELVKYRAEFTYLRAHQAQFAALESATARSPVQWQHWLWADLAGMIAFIPTIWLIKGRWSPRRARADEEAHERAVAEELAKLSAVRPGEATAAV